MKKTIAILTIVLFVVFMVGCENSVNPTNSDSLNLTLAKADGETMSLAKDKCATIQGGTILYSATHFYAGAPITVGFDDFGYNYQGHMFDGLYYNSYAGGAGFGPWNGDDEAYLLLYPDAVDHWAWPYRDIELAMKWNDAWVSNKDCDGNGSLDRHYGYPSYDNSGAWLTNHQKGENWCEGTAPWTYFVKIITPSTANGDYKLPDGKWYDADDVEIGKVIWGQFATVLQVSNDQCIEGEHGVYYKSPKSPGLGLYSSFDVE